MEHTGIFKQLTGGDQITAEVKGGVTYEFEYKGVVWLIANHELIFCAYDEYERKAMETRLMPIECKNVIQSADKDKKLIDKMILEKEAFVNLLIKEAKKWIDSDYAEPTLSAHIKENIHTFSVGSNNILAFIDEIIVYNPKAKRIKASEVYNCYKDWRQYRRTSHDKIQHEQHIFYDTIEHNVPNINPIDSGVRYWHCIELNPDKWNGKYFIGF